MISHQINNVHIIYLNLNKKGISFQQKCWSLFLFLFMKAAGFCLLVLEKNVYYNSDCCYY